jgi:predicted DNA-binding transcriptional regulator YafY
MYFPTTRVLTVLELLQSRGQMSGPELASRLEVDARTVRRYITMLQDLGIPVEAERGRYGAYRLRPGFKLPPLLFTDDEALALTLGLLVSRKMGLTAAAPAVEGALAKVERVLPQVLRERIQAVQDTIVLDIPPARTNPSHEIVVTLSEAAGHSRRVQLGYRAYEAEEETTRPFDPYGLVYRPGYWYTVGYCHLRSSLRIFRLDRIRRVELRDETFVRPADFDCLTHVVQSISQVPATWFVEVLLEINLEEARRIVPPTLAQLEQTPAGVRLTCYVEELDWIAYKLVGLDCPLVVKQPAELREELLRLAERTAGLARRSLSADAAIDGRTNKSSH